jgi:hypothetical protein
MKLHFASSALPSALAALAAIVTVSGCGARVGLCDESGSGYACGRSTVDSRGDAAGDGAAAPDGTGADGSTDGDTPTSASDGGGGDDAFGDTSGGDDGGGDVGDDGGACALASVPTGFTCGAATRMGQHSCTESDIEALDGPCFTMPTTTACEAALTAHPGCASCLRAWLTADGYLDVGACVTAIAPGDPCAKELGCLQSCREAVCASCSNAPGSGSGGDSAQVDCGNEVLTGGGACSAVPGVGVAGSCLSTAAFMKCVDPVQFLRGACRDGGDFSHTGS